MKKRAWVLAACLLTTGVASVALPAQAQVSIGVQIGPTMAPPPPQYEAVPVMPSGYVWTPGYWQWREGGYAWRPGYRVHERPGYHWRHRDRDDDDRDYDRGRYHCPPGHAKKGEC
jgi:hypothetical protein